MTKTLRSARCSRVVVASDAARCPRAVERPIRSRCSRATTSASSATRSPSGCSTTAGSRRCCYARFPKHDLVIRNLGFSGDEIATRLRSKNFGTPDEWLSGKAEPIGGYQENRLAGTNTKADVIFAFFGYNESYAGEAGLAAFKQQLDDWITHTLAQKYNGKSAPRIVLFSPIAHEDLHNPDLPDGSENNARLELYTRAMAEVAAARGVRSSTCSRRPGRCSRRRRRR